jgi:hypothetical protein
MGTPASDRLRTSGWGFKTGDVVRFDTHSNLGICVDTIRCVFMQDQSIGGTPAAPAAVLTHFSWTYLSNCTKVTGGTDDAA